MAGNVDVVHEQMALTHSHIPDIALGYLATVFKQNGVFMFDSNSSHFRLASRVKIANGNVVDTSDDTYAINRLRAIEVGIRMLAKFGLIKIGEWRFEGTVFQKTV